MDLYEVITQEYPELKEVTFEKVIVLQDDSDGLGAYIREWNYSKPIPAGLKLGK